MENNNFLKTYTLLELFDGTFKILKTNWKNTLLVSLLCFFPLSVLFSISIHTFIERVLKAASFDVLDNIKRISPLLSSIFLALLVFIIIYLIATIFTRAVIVLNTFQTVHKKKSDLKNLVIKVFQEKLGKLLLQTLLIIAIFYMIFLFGGFLLEFFSSIFKSLSFSNIIYILFYIVFTGFIVWLFICFSFSFEILVYYEGISVAKSIIKSFNMVKYYWWRIFGIIAISNIALFFAISIISSPIIFSTMLPNSEKFLKTSLDKSSEIDYITSLLIFYKNYNISLGISMFIQNVLSFLIMPAFMSLLFIDLKHRDEQKLKDKLLPSEPFDSSYNPVTREKPDDEE